MKLRTRKHQVIERRKRSGYFYARLPTGRTVLTHRSMCRVVGGMTIWGGPPADDARSKRRQWA